MSNDAYRVAYEFVKEQSCGEWTDEQIASDATSLSATLRAYAADVLAHQGDPSPRMICVVPVGWKLVPMSATQDMIKAGESRNVDSGMEQAIYSAMLGEAPEPPLPVSSLQEMSDAA